MFKAARGLVSGLWPCLACLLVLLALAQILWTPCLTLSAGERRLAMYEAGPGLTLTIDFIHSVQKTPVREVLAVEEGGGALELLETRYHSFGVGLPFLESEGDFRQEGDEFVLRGMGRHFPELGLRTGVGTQLTLTVKAGGRGEEVFRLYEEFPPGTRIDVRLQPLYKILLGEGKGK